MHRGIFSHPATLHRASGEDVPGYVRFAGIASRSIFIIALLVVTVWVSRPQFASNWLEHFTLGDFVRVMLGVAAGLWMIVHLFKLPKDAQAYVTWAGLGLALTPLILIYLVLFW